MCSLLPINFIAFSAVLPKTWTDCGSKRTRLGNVAGHYFLVEQPTLKEQIDYEV